MSRASFDWVRQQLPDSRNLELTPLRAEASHRSFYRATYQAPASGEQPLSRVLMISPPDKEQNDQFVALARVFARAAVPVPEIVASDAEHGWFLLTDLGEQDLEAVYAGPERDAALAAAIKTLVRLQAVEDPAIPPYTAERFADELEIFAHWFAEASLDLEVPAPVRNVFSLLVERTRGQQQCCVHRDYHCRNLLFNAEEAEEADEAGGRIGVVDFQDALRGPASYDPASLLHDCYHEFSPADVRRWLDYYLSLTPLELDPETFRVDVDFIAIQRQLKAIGIFARLQLRDARSTHLGHIEPVLARTKRLASSYPALGPLAEWLEQLDVRQAMQRLNPAARG